MSAQEDTYPLAEAAARAGIEPPELDQMVELQMIVPRGDGVFTSGDVRKAALLAGLGAGGLPLEAIAAEIRGGRLSARLHGRPDLRRLLRAESADVRSTSPARTGIRVELLLAIREAVGSAVPRSTDRVREIELAIVPLIEAQLASGYPDEVVERSLRTMGESLRRFVLAEADDFRATSSGR